MKKIVIVCLILFFSTQTHGAGKWRERVYRFLPLVAPKAYKLEKLEKQKKAQLTQKVTSLSDLELIVLDSELKGHSNNITALEGMAQLVRKEIFRRIDGNEQAKILDMLASMLTARLDSVLSNPKTAPHFFEAFQDAARGDLPERYRDILREFLSAKNEEIMALDPTPEQIKGLVGITHSTDVSINILQKALDKGKNADEFFATFDAIAWPSPFDEYRNALNKFFIDNADTLEKLPLSPEQIKYIERYVLRIPTGIALLKGGLQRAEGDASQFFSTFKAVTSFDNPNHEYRDALNKFFIDNAEAIHKLYLSPEQIEHIARYTNRVPIEIMFLEEGLKRAAGDANKFFAVFKAVAWGHPPEEKYQNMLNKFFIDNADTLEKLPLSPEQIKYIERYVLRIPTGIALLKGGLQRAEGDADQFFSTFKAVTSFDNPNDEYKKALNKFFIDNAETIKELSLSPKQVKHIAEYIKIVNTNIRFLNTGLKQAKGSADRFFATFKAITDLTPSKDYQDALDKFFTGDAEAISELSLPPEQIEHIARYINRDSTEIAFLKQGLKRAKDADEFFATFNAIAWASPPAKTYPDVLNKFFVQNADRIKEFAFSAEQVDRIGHYINKDPTFIILLEGGFKHAERDTDEFFALFRAITSGPSESYRDALNTFFIDNAEKIMNLGLSIDQMEYLGHKINRYSTSIRILELTLEKAEHAGDFFTIFHIVAPDSPGSKSKSIYGNFLTDHAKPIVDLGPSPDQMEKIGRYISSPEILFNMAKNQKEKREVCAASMAILLFSGPLEENTESAI